MYNHIELINIDSEKNSSKILQMLRIIDDISDLTAYSGPLGKLLGGKLWTLNVGPYERIEVEDFPTVEENVLKKFSNDAKDLYRLCIAVTSGMKHISIRNFSWSIGLFGWQWRIGHGLSNCFQLLYTISKAQCL